MKSDAREKSAAVSLYAYCYPVRAQFTPIRLTRKHMHPARLPAMGKRACTLGMVIYMSEMGKVFFMDLAMVLPQCPLC